jgi:UDP-N-acetylmuramoyl-L-alanine---L-glutamate ligase
MDKYNKIAIIGFGKEGQSLFKYFFGKVLQIDIYDEKKVDLDLINNLPEKEKTNVSIILGLELQDNYDEVFKSPGISFHKITYKSGINQEIFFNSLVNLLFCKLDKNKIIAVTGTKGKSTTASLINFILIDNGYKSQLLGNIGNINLDLLDKDDEDCYYVFEVSSFQTEFLQASPKFSIFTSFYLDHQDVHADLSEYLHAKLNLINHISSEDMVFFSRQFFEVLKAHNFEIPKQSFIVDYKNSFETNLLGQHNQINCQIAFEVASSLRLDTQQIIDSIKKYIPLSGRLEMVGSFAGIDFYADDLATIPEATWSAIESFDQEKLETIIIGGYNKGLNYDQLASDLVDTKIKNFIYFNPTGSQITSKLDSKKVNVIEAKSMKEAVEVAYNLTSKNKICLLSCASASFGLFKNSTDRGQQFRDSVKEIGAKF